MVVGPSSRHIAILDALAATFAEQRYYLLYVLLLSHAGREPGRFQSPVVDSHEDLQLFIWTFQNFLEQDGRHHLWISAADSSQLLVYDQHNVIFAYGDDGRFESVLKNMGFKEEAFWFPSPHFHGYEPSSSNAENELISYFNWQRFDLQLGDEWD